MTLLEPAKALQSRGDVGSQPNKKLLTFIHKTRYTLVPEIYTDTRSTPATVIKHLRERSQTPV